MDQRVIGEAPLPLLHLGNLGADGRHRLDEAIQFALGFRLGRLDHQGARYREAHGRRVEAVVHQPLGHVHLADAGSLLERTDIQNALVGHPTVAARVEHREGFTQLLGQIVGVEDGDLSGSLQPLVTQHGDIHPADGQDAGRAERCRRHGAVVTALLVGLDHGVTGHERCQMFLHADGAHARAATAVRNGEGLVQVEVRDVCPDKARCRQSNLRVHVGAVQIDLTTVLVNDVAHLLDGLLIHPVGGGVGHHQTGELIPRLGRLGAQVVEIHVAGLVTGGDDHLEPRHLGRGRVGTVGRSRDQADVAMPFTTRLVIFLDGEQTCVFALGT